jgi:hypothetical protein
MAGVPKLISSDLRGLLVDEGGGPSPLEVLILNNTSVDDDAAPFISGCPSLRVLELASTKFTSKHNITKVYSRRPKHIDIQITVCLLSWVHAISSRD